MRPTELRVYGGAARGGMASRAAAPALLALACAAEPTASSSDTESTMVAVDWSAPAAATTTAIPTYLDQVNPSMDRASPMHDAAFSRMDKLGAKLVRYLHWSSSQAPFAELEEGKFNFTKMDEYVLDFLACKNAPGSVMNFDAGPVGRQPPPGSLGLRTGRLHPFS